MTQTNHFISIIEIIKESRTRAFKAVNSELINLYLEIGKYIKIKITEDGWGKSTVNQLAKYIQKEHPELKGFSNKNLWRMKQFHETYMDFPEISTLLRENKNELTNTLKDSYVFEFLNLKPTILNLTM